jgi:3-methylfumaryl-CoA hydratase
MCRPERLGSSPGTALVGNEAMEAGLKHELESCRAWIGRRETARDTLLALHVAGLAAMLDRDDPMPAEGDPAPAAAHWLVRGAWVRQSELGPDGHPKRGGFLPPVSLPRRMWAGSRIEFLAPLRVGDEVERRSEIADVVIKEGRGGRLLFVTVRHAYHRIKGVAVREEQDIVYREAADRGRPGPAPGPAPADGPWRREVMPDAVMLFRYSALIFNAHRIHYDRTYATELEGYPGLVVHGPLLATLLLDLVRRERPAMALARFTFRAIAPVFDTAPIMMTGAPLPDGRGAAVWIRRADGVLAMRGEAGFAQ